jgi:hypothetical protein
MKRVLLACLVGLVGAVALAASHGAGAATCQYGPCPLPATLTITGVHQAANGVTTLTVKGAGYGSNETVLLSAFNPLRSVGTAHTSSSGSFSVAVVLPAGYGPGTHTLVGTGTVSGRSASAPFTLSRPTAAVVPCTTSAGSDPSAQFVLAACVSTQLPASGASGATPAAGASGPGGAAPGSGGSLPFTGIDIVAISTVGAVAIGTGGLLVLISRRRRRKSWLV